ncbi:hypothetical protein BGX20_002269 [Mortierella sp. AD010]|nr:hypothetical protein BGX20_002269 [Mortierella sp. AD010]
MPSTDSTMQSISAPIIVPGTQQEPTVPFISSPVTGNIPTVTNNHRASLPITRVSMHNGGSASPSGPGLGNNTNSGLGRFPSIGNTKKLSVENMTLKAKVTELERYVAGMKGELMLFTRKSHTLQSEIKEAEDLHATETRKLEEHINRCEFELGSKVIECEALNDQLIEKERAHQQLLQLLQEQEQKRAQQEQQNKQRDEKIKALMEENTRKDALINELLKKVGQLGTELLNIEREKAHLERDPSPTPADTTMAEATPSASTHNLTIQTQAEELSDSQSDSSFNASTSTSPTTTQSENEECDLTHGDSTATTLMNSVGYDVSLEHPKLLAKFQALRIQHAQTSEYLELLENENKELKVQLLDVDNGSGAVAAH